MIINCPAVGEVRPYFEASSCQCGGLLRSWDTLGFAYGAVVKSFDSFVFLCCCLNCSVRVATAVVPSYVEQMRQDSILEKWRAPHDCWAPPGCHRCSDKRSGTVGVRFWWKCISEAKSSYVYLEVYVHIIVLYYDFVGLDISWNICLSRRLCMPDWLVIKNNSDCIRNFIVMNL